MSKQGTTVFFSSHILSDVQDIATKIGILNWGHIEAIGTLEQLKNKFIEENAIEIILSRNSGKWDIIQSIDGIRLIEQIDEKKIIAHIDKRKDNDEIIHQIITELLKKDCRIRHRANFSHRVYASGEVCGVGKCRYGRAANHGDAHGVR